MAQSTLNVLKRNRMGKSGAKEIRNEGNVPAILYGKGTDPLALVVNPSELKQALSTDARENTLLQMSIDGEKLEGLSLLREIQYDFISSKPIHFDFQAIDMNAQIEVKVPINIIGRANGVKEGGILEEILREIEVLCLPSNIPDFFDVDVTDLEMGHTIHVRDIEVADDISILRGDGESIVAVHAPKVEVIEVEEEEGEEIEGEEVEGEEVEGEEVEAPSEKESE